MGATILEAGKSAGWKVGGDSAVRKTAQRHVYVHLPMRKVGAKIRLAGGVELDEGDGAFVSDVSAGDELVIESVGEGEAEVVVLDSE